jgi:hypothetical protein
MIVVLVLAVIWLVLATVVAVVIGRSISLADAGGPVERRLPTSVAVSGTPTGTDAA